MTLSTDLEPRTYFSRIETALADFAPPVEAVPTILETVRSLHFAHVYIPESRAYIALETDDGGAPIAYVMPHVIALHPRDGVSSFVPLVAQDDAVPQDDAEVAEQVSVPVAAEEAPTEQVAVPVPVEVAVADAVAVCGSCFTNLPATGRCDYCE